MEQSNMWFLKWIGIFLALFVGLSKIARADALDSWTTWSTAQPYVSKQLPPSVLVMRGEGTDAYYVVEVDPATGAIPVDATVVIPPGSEIEVTNFPTTVDVNYGTPGTSTLRSASMLGVGSTAVSNSNPVPISDAGGVITVDGTVAVSNLPATVDTNAGAASASTLRTTQASRSYSDSARYDYTGGAVTTGTWVEVDSSTAAAINLVCVTDQSGQVMELGSGAAMSETRILLIARGWSGCIPLRIAASTRLAIKAVSATASTGDFVYSGMQ